MENAAEPKFYDVVCKVNPIEGKEIDIGGNAYPAEPMEKPAVSKEQDIDCKAKASSPETITDGSEAMSGGSKENAAEPKLYDADCKENENVGRANTAELMSNAAAL
ncbi:MAG: hypothetical protein CVU09_15995 [Bacteroidetes bacterium HGW-Bacteroidetes-4]|jgi:hypothetical protein|nr:MAG: hypothetical protein CVU09_15995 [Bacteroidetes bacterium HGW-Bacteroidetes-4]